MVARCYNILRHPLTCSGLVCVQRCELFVCFVDIGGIVSHQCMFKGVRLEVVVRFVDIGGIVSNQCLAMQSIS